MLSLGISQDLCDSGVALADGERVLYAANEERFTSVKGQGGFPRLSLAGLFRATGIDAGEVGRICVAGEMTPPLPLRVFPGLHEKLTSRPSRDGVLLKDRLVDFAVFRTPLLHAGEGSLLRSLTRPFLGLALRRSLPPELRSKPVIFVEHHRAHAAAAFALSGFPEALVLTADGMGDGLSFTVSRHGVDSADRLWTASSRASLGLFFEALTEAMGFTPRRDEGKLTGLAARGDATRVSVPSPFLFRDGQLHYRGPFGLRAVNWARRDLLGRFAPEDVAAWAQRILEEHVTTVARTWLGVTGLGSLCVAGGVFANVRLNQRLHELEGVASFFVCPNMGDGGLSVGALCAEGGIARRLPDDVFWGDCFREREIREAMDERGMTGERVENIDEAIAAALAEGLIVARFTGPMEWGPRALGNRSILAAAADASVPRRLNRLLRRSDFMPFAPAILDEDLDTYALRSAAARRAAEFMTVCFDCTEAMKRENPAVVHVDGTARIQVVQEVRNPALHRILSAYRRRTGRGALLNTSFNIHEQPVVRTPGEALDTFRSAGLDRLALGDVLVKGAA